MMAHGLKSKKHKRKLKKKIHTTQPAIFSQSKNPPIKWFWHIILCMIIIAIWKTKAKWISNLNAYNSFNQATQEFDQHEKDQTMIYALQLPKYAKKGRVLKVKILWH